MKRQKFRWQPLIVLSLMAVFFVILFYRDNKYQAPPPYGKSGVIVLHEEDFQQDDPIFLIDGWLLTDGRVTEEPTYIGEFSNLQRGDRSASPHGKARYQLTLRYDGAPRVVSVDFPELFMEYKLFLNGTQLSSGIGNGSISFLLTPGCHTLTVETSSELGYYSGMYFPPALGTGDMLLRIKYVQNFVYALGVLVPLALAAFSSFLWWMGGRLDRWFWIMCCCYALYMFRYFVFLFSMPAVRHWFLVQSVALYGLCFCVLQITALSSGGEGGKAWRGIRAVLGAMSIMLLILSLLTSKVSWAVPVHAGLMNVYYCYIFFCAVFFTARGIAVRNWESKYILTGGSVFGSGLFINLLFANRFEPIRFLWQFEWCGFFLVVLFGVMMVSRNRRILQENDMLTNHLEEQVRRRTEEVTQLLEERKSFFSDMAHDLKAPVFATQSFIDAIRKRGVGVDMELRGYLDQAEAKQREMARRLQGLSAINELDKIKEEWARISVREMLSEILSVYGGEAEVRSVHFFVEEPEEDGFLSAQPGKLDLLFENLIYNALRAASRGGSITVAARAENGRIYITVEDTGCGIPREELPFIFERFYVGAGNRENGTGLGLYIVNSIVAEMGGTIGVESAPGVGTKFSMEFPESVEGTV